MADDVAAIQRRQRNQVEDCQYDIDPHRQIKQVRQRAGYVSVMKVCSNAGIRTVPDDGERDDGEKRGQEIAGRPGHGGQNVVAN